MAMVTIRRGGHICKVSASAYNKIYKPKGYIVINTDATMQTKPQIDDGIYSEENDIAEEDVTADDVETIPISEMNQEQLREFAKIHDIDLSGIKKLSEARRIVREAMAE